MNAYAGNALLPFVSRKEWAYNIPGRNRRAGIYEIVCEKLSWLSF